MNGTPANHHGVPLPASDNRESLSHSNAFASQERAPKNSSAHYLGARPNVEDDSTYLNPAVRGVNFAVNIDGGISIRAVVSADVLKAYFGANDDPKSWMKAAKQQMGLLQWLAKLQYLASKSAPLVLTMRSVEAQLEFERKHAMQQEVGEDPASQAAAGKERLGGSASPPSLE